MDIWLKRFSFFIHSCYLRLVLNKNKMLLTQHLLMGAAIGRHVDSFLAVVLLAFFSHYLLDIIPHRSMSAVNGYKENGLKGVRKKELLIKSIEPVLGITITIVFILLNSDYAANMAIGALFGFLPDFFTFIIWKKDLKKFDKLVPRPGIKWYRQSKTLAWGVATQVAVFIVASIAIFK